jgi:DNA-binding NarL/FixJ family response regulator
MDNQTPRPTQVFIVDDSAWIRLRLAEALARIPGVSLVGEAASAEEAVVGILRTRPDSVLLDLYLMGHTGLDVMKAVRETAPEIVFVVLTNHSESQYRDACMEAGATYFLDKSQDFDRVPAVLAEIAATLH